MHDSAPASAQQHSHPCGGCGARVEYAPGTHTLQCPYCGYSEELAAPTREVREHDYKQLVTKARKSADRISAHHMHCRQCGARFNADALSKKCQFCGASLVTDTSDDPQIEPEAVLPFAMERAETRTALRTWVNSRWFAPNRLKNVTEAESMKSTYVPHWTFDAQTESRYQGQRGEHYYETETYTVEKDGEEETRTRSVRKTRWYPASGTVGRSFDDVLVVATTHLTTERLRELEPWALGDARPYTPAYLAGHEALRYDVEPDHGIVDAKRQMAETIEKDCCQDIGGDVQRVHSVDTDYSDITAKLLLLPVWTGCYVYQGKTWQILINGCTGEVQGERPYSAAKITAAALAALIVVAVLVWLYIMYK